MADVETVIVGAGPAGLAVAACLRRAGRSCTILERAHTLGSAWHRHYERLRLHTDRWTSALPLAPFAKSCPKYPSRGDMIAYLESYARRFGLEPRLGQEVCALRRSDEGWETRTADACIVSDNVVLATGNALEPHCPQWPGQDSYRGRVLHSSDYRNGREFRGQDTLVVGFGNSGAEIALDLREHGAKAQIALRGAANVIPRDVLGVPIVVFGILMERLPPRFADILSAPVVRLSLGNVSRLGLGRPRIGPMEQIARHGRIPVIDVGTINLVKRGDLGIRPGVSWFTREGVVFADGREEHFDTVVLATGYRTGLEKILAAENGVLDARGRPLASGSRAARPGLYFCGFHVAAGGMLREISREARAIAACIAGK